MSENIFNTIMEEKDRILRKLCRSKSRPENERIIQEVENLLEDSPDIINTVSEDGLTPLHLAAINNQAGILSALLSHGADPELRDAVEGFTPLLYTITQQSLECFEILLKKGVNVDACDKGGQSALYHAVVHHYVQGRMVEKLLKFGADVNLEVKGQTLLHVAARVGNPRVLQELLDAKPKNIDMLDNSKLSPLHLAAENGHRDCCEILKKAGANCSVRNKHKETPLMLAVKNSYTKTCEVLLENSKASVNEVNNFHQTPVIIAANKNTAASVFVLRTLLKHQPDLTATTSNGDTALHYAAKCGSAEKCRDLIEAGADHNITNAQGMTPIHWAAKNNFRSCVAVLLGFSEEETWNLVLPDSDRESINSVPCTIDLDNKNLIDVNIKDKQGMTPLHYALMKDSEECFKLLIKKRANVNLKNNKNKTPLHVAAERGLAKCCAWLLCKGADVLAKTDEEKTALHLAAAAGSLACCKILLKKEAKLNNIADKTKMTPLHYAAKVGSADCCELLLKKIERYFESCSADTPLHLAAQKGCSDCCKLLVQNIYTEKYLARRNTDGQMPHNVAFENGKDDAFCFLLRMALEYMGRKMSSEKSRSKGKYRKEDVPSLKPTLNDLLTRSIKQQRSQAIEALVKCMNWSDVFSSENEKGVRSNFCQLIQYFPKAAKVVLDGCIEAGQNGKKIYRFTILENIYSCSEEKDRTDSGFSRRNIMIKLKISFFYLLKLISETKSGGHIFRIGVKMYERFYQAVDTPPKFLSLTADMRKQQISSEDNSPVIDEIPNCSPFFRDGTLKPWARERPEIETSGPGHPLICMVENKRLGLLGHEVCQKLLKYKWDFYVKRTFYGLFLFSALFVGILSSYVTLAYDWVYVHRMHNLTRENFCERQCTNSGREHANTQNIIHDLRSNSGNCISSKPDFIAEAELHQSSVRILALMILVINIIIEVFRIHQLYVGFRQMKRLAPTLISYVCSAVLLVNWTECTQITGIREDWQWICGVLSVMLGWFNVVMLLGWIPSFGRYLIILSDFMTTMLKLAVFLLLQVIAFSVAFQMLLRDRFVFSNYPRTTVKILTMIMGDLSYDDHFSNQGSPLHYPLLSHLLLICFLGIIGVIMLNLISNFSQEELDKAKKQTKLITLSRHVEMILEMESMFPKLRRHYARAWVEDWLVQKSAFPYDFGSVYSCNELSKEQVNEEESANSCKCSTDSIKCLLEDIKTQIKELKSEEKLCIPVKRSASRH
ncbi:transient receptor potential cation channel subfamily A member 1 homolog [Palaemon carinicauda]|uniref:transient receptor potential cation channel subfamily A member 1 homolog n=1 Tax=Palaemon carinicauda TaxID=392227 RepID=UPI0035B5D539